VEGQAPLSVTADFSSARLSYRGVPCASAAGKLDMHFTSTGSVVRIAPLTVVREEGQAAGGLSVVDDNGRCYAAFDATSSIAPQALTGLIGIMTNGFWDVCRTRGPYAGSARGYVNYRNLDDSSFRGQIRLGAFGNDRLTISNAACELGMVGSTVAVRNISGALCGGNVTGMVDVALPTGTATAMCYRVAGSAQEVDFPALVGALRRRVDKDYMGALTLSFDVAGPVAGNFARAMQGNGSVRLRHGRVFMLPLFGGLSSLLTRIIPGLDFVLRQTDLKARFDIAGGKLFSEKVLIEGDVLSLEGNGVYDIDGTLAFDAQVRLMKERTLVAKLLRTATYPITKLFELRLTGTIEAPRWHAVNFSSDIIDRIGHVTGLLDDNDRRELIPGEASAPANSAR